MTGKGFYSVAKQNGVWWFIDPQGSRFISKGVDNIRFIPDQIKGTDIAPYADNCKAKYGTEEKWRTAAVERLWKWGFNTIGAWSDAPLKEIVINNKKMAHAPIIDFGSAFLSHCNPGSDSWLHGIFPDVFDSRFEPFVRELAQKKCTPLKDDTNLIGWFTDNELRWGPDWRGPGEILTMFLMLPEKAAGRSAALDHLKKRYKTFVAFNDIWHTLCASWEELGSLDILEPPFVMKALWEQNQQVEHEENSKDPRRAAFTSDCESFVGLLADRYFSITNAALKAADPNHLNFGARFAYVPQRAVAAAAGRHLDVISFNCYSFEPFHAIDVYAATGKPCLIGEFSYRGDDAGLPNTRGAGPRVPTQADRAKAFENFITLALSSRSFIGYHWFEHSDEPVEGRFDGENSNYGCVNIKDDVYGEITEAMRRVNGMAEEIHAKAIRE